MIESFPRRARLLIALGAIMLAGGCSRPPPGPCTRFGDPPAQLIANIIPHCAKGVRLGPWKDSDGVDRYACRYEPTQAAASASLPLVVWLHPSLLTADSIEHWTNLIDHLSDANLSGNPARRGFILIAPEGRNTHHYYAPPDASGSGWDNWYRQFSPQGDLTVDGKLYRENVDAATIDHFVAAEQATGKIDPQRIYLSGWSNGGAMAYAYGFSRPQIAAIAVYSAPDPYELALDQCPQKPVTSAPANHSELQLFNLTAPSYQVHNNCDIAGLCPNALSFEAQLRALGYVTADTIIDHAQTAVAQCDHNCGTNPDGDLLNFEAASRGALNHLRWPDRWTAAMLDFFRQHPLKAHP